jgi:hypothetical protein
MSSFLDLSLDTGPGSYEIQDHLGQLSLKHYNSPRPIIAKAEKTNKQFLGAELNKQLSGLESPGVNTYSPDLLKVLENSPSAFFGSEKRTMSHITPLLDRSPGPVYTNLSPVRRAGITFAKSRRHSNIDDLSPAPWDYNPSVPRNKMPSVIFRATYEKNLEKYLTPGPGSYNVGNSSAARGAYVSKVGRNIVCNRDPSPGPGTYDSKPGKVLSKAKFGGDRRDFDPRICKI